MKIKKTFKKLCGEQLAQYLVRNFNQDDVSPVIKKLFNNGGRDIAMVRASDYEQLKKILNAKLYSEESTEVKQPHPDELLKTVGYSLHKSEDHDDVLSYKRFFEPKYELCKFNDSQRVNNYHIYWIVKDNAQELSPLDDPKRQDEYGVSVCSIQISKDGRNVTQITNRYNHVVSGCDNTFNSNLDNIIDGLTDSFNQHLGHSLRKGKSNELLAFVEMDGVLAYYHSEHNGVKFGDNTIISDKIHNYSKDSYYLYDYFLINLKTKKIEWDKDMMGYDDGFVTAFNDNVKCIEFVQDIDTCDDGGSDETCFIQRL